MSNALVVAFAIAIPFVCSLKRIQDRELVRARDAWLCLMLTAAVIAMAPVELWLALVGLGILLRWRSHHLVPTLVVWLAIAFLWVTTGALPPTYAEWLPVGWLGIAGLELVIAIWQYAFLRSREPQFATVRRPIGTYGQRTLLAAFFALVLPFWVTSWWAAIPAAGLLLTDSWLAYVAVAGGLAVLAPWTIFASVGIACLVAAMLTYDPRRMLQYTPRGDTTDSIRQRLLTWRLAFAHLRFPVSLVGRGPYAAVYDLLRWSARYRVEPVHGHMHCEPLEFVYEWGVIGALVLGAFAWRVIPHLAIGDPWSAAAVTGGVLACGTLFCRCTPLGAMWLVICSIVAHRA